MAVRLFDWRDLSTIHRYRRQCVFLDSALVLTRGPWLVEGALFSSLAPSMLGIFTCVMDEEGTDSEAASRASVIGQPVIGQFNHQPDSPLSYLTFLAPGSALESSKVSPLIEYMMMLSGERGALRLLADVDERTPAIEALHRCGFAIYTRQRAWQLTGSLSKHSQTTSWRSATSQDVILIRSLYHNLVPALVQQAEPFSTQPPKGLVCYQQDELVAYVELRSGRRGIWAQPFVHPDAENVSERFLDLLGNIPGRRTRPVYICVRSYQSWLESVVEELGAEAGPRQAVMMRQLATQQRVARPFSLPNLDTGQPEMTAPVAQLESK